MFVTVNNVKFNDEPKFPAYLTYATEKVSEKYNNINEAVGQGFHTDDSLAKLKSIGEFFERLCNYIPHGSILKLI